MLFVIGLVLFKNMIIVPNEGSLRENVLEGHIRGSLPCIQV